MSALADDARCDEAAPPTAPAPDGALYLDGTSNRKHPVTLHLAADLEIREDGRVLAAWPYAAIRRADGPAGRLRLACTAALPFARLEIADAALAGTVAARCPSLDHGRGDASQAWRIVGWSLAAACSIVAVAVFGIPLLAERLAPLVPAGLEARIGEAVDKQVRVVFKGEPCTGAQGRAAFDALIDRLARAGALEIPLEARVLSSSAANAVALPGGRIYVFDGLLQRAANADELAGVIAHELGHVRHRDNLRRIIEIGGSSFLLGLLFGDTTGTGAVIFASRTLLDASHSREAERRADAYTVELMHRLGRSPAPMGELLFRITGAQAKKTIPLLASHPLTEDRLAEMRRQERPSTGPELITAQQWAALKAICKAR